jgi:hypothetical protein
MFVRHASVAPKPRAGNPAATLAPTPARNPRREILVFIGFILHLPFA